MFRRRRKRRMPELNMTSTADISFMLLVFFLITTSIDNNKGMMRRLPPPQDDREQAELAVKRRNVLIVEIDAGGNLQCNGKPTAFAQLKSEVETFVDNAENLDTLPEKTISDVPLIGTCSVSDKHVVLIKVDANTTYDAYFRTYNAIVGAYTDLRNGMARKFFGKNYAQCSAAQREAIASCYPHRISDSDIERKGGGI